MADSPFLKIPLLSTSQAAKEATINAAISMLERAMNDAITLNFAGANLTLPVTDLLRYFLFKATAVGGSSILNITPTKRLFAIDNLMNASNLTLKAGTPTLVIPAGGIVIVYCDGTNLISVADSTVMGGGGGGPTTFISLLDTPASYAGLAGQVMRVKSTEDGLEGEDFTIAALTDVDLAGILDGYILTWDATASKFKAVPASSTGGGGSAAMFKAVDVSTTEEITIASDLVIGMVIDSLPLTVGMRVLVKDQSTKSQNGVWEITADAPVRAADATDPGSFIQGSVIPVLFGALNGLKLYMQTTPDGTPLTPGVSPLEFRTNSMSMSDIKDVDADGLANGNVLVWNQVEQKWEPGAGGGGGSLPTGGTTGQVLTKNSNADGDAGWVDQTGGSDELPTGGATGQVLAKASGTDGDVEWVDQTGGGGGTFKKEISFFAAGKGKNNETLVAYTTPVAVTIGATGSSARAVVAAAAYTVYTIKIQGVSVGTVTFGTGSTTGTINFTGSGAIPAGGTLIIAGPPSADTALADVYMTFKEA